MNIDKELNKEIDNIKNELDTANADLEKLSDLKDKMRSGIDDLKSLSDQNTAFQNSLSEVISKLSNIADPLKSIISQNNDTFLEINKKHSDIQDMLSVQHEEFSKLVNNLKKNIVILLIVVLAVSIFFIYYIFKI